MNKKTIWRNASKDELPIDNKEVVISIDGINYNAVYNAEKQGFELKAEPRKFLEIKNTVIYWTEAQ